MDFRLFRSNFWVHQLRLQEEWREGQVSFENERQTPDHYHNVPAGPQCLSIFLDVRMQMEETVTM